MSFVESLQMLEKIYALYKVFKNGWEIVEGISCYESKRNVARKSSYQCWRDTRRILHLLRIFLFNLDWNAPRKGWISVNIRENCDTIIKGTHLGQERDMNLLVWIEEDKVLFDVWWFGSSWIRFWKTSGQEGILFWHPKTQQIRLINHRSHKIWRCENFFTIKIVGHWYLFSRCVASTSCCEQIDQQMAFIFNTIITNSSKLEILSLWNFN